MRVMGAGAGRMRALGACMWLLWGRRAHTEARTWLWHSAVPSAQNAGRQSWRRRNLRAIKMAMP